MSFLSFRRYYLDKVLLETSFSGKVLDIGGKKDNKRGLFRPPLHKVDDWEYLNIDESTKPDYCCSANNIPVGDNIFDIVLIAEVLEHLENPDIVLMECNRILKHGGKIVATMPFLYPIHADPYDFQRWTDKKITIEMNKVGFKEVIVKPMGSVFAVIFDLLRVSLGAASKNPNALKNKIINKFIMPLLVKLFLFCDEKYMYKNSKITTGYFVSGYKL